MFFLNLYVLKEFVYFFKCDNVKVEPFMNPKSPCDFLRGHQGGR